MDEKAPGLSRGSVSSSCLIAILATIHEVIRGFCLPFAGPAPGLRPLSARGINVRWTLRILAGLALLLATASLLATLPVIGDQPPGLLPPAPAIASIDGDLAFATNIVGLVAATQRRQWN